MKDTKKPEEVLKTLKPSDFDGHTEFRKLSSKERLRWLSQMASFLWKSRQLKSGK